MGIGIVDTLNKPYSAHVSSGKFSISSIGSCFRRKYLEMRGEWKEGFDEPAKRIFSAGDIYHREILKEIIVKGAQTGWHVVAAELTLQHPFLSGRIDAVLSDGKELFICDFKSAGSYTMKKVHSGEVSDAYKNQVMLYMYITGIHKGFLLFVGKDKGALEEYEVVYDEAKALELIAKVKDFMENNVAKNIEPPRCDGQPWGCKCCGIEKSFGFKNDF